MFKKKWKKSLALALSLIMLCIGGNGAGLVQAQGKDGRLLAREVTDSAIDSEELPDDGAMHPPGGADEMPVYETDDWRAVEKVPSYEGKRVPYSDEETVFSRGTDDYGYKSLSENQQKFYLKIQASLEAFQASGKGFEEVSAANGKKYYAPFKVNYSNYQLNENDMLKTWLAFQADYPWLYWLNGCLNMSTAVADTWMPTARDDYKDIETIKGLDAKIETGVQAYLDEVENEKDVYEKVRIISDKIIHSVNYAYKANGSTPEDADWAHTIVGALDGEHGLVVCEGYAKLFSFLMNILDIPSVYVEGTAGGPHAWNCVSFDGGDTYYYVDVTWDDASGKNSYFENEWLYFAMPKTNFEKRHKAYSPNSSSYLNWLYPLPALGDDMEYTYFEKYFAHPTSALVDSEETAVDFLKRARAMAPGETCLLLLDDKSVSSLIATVLEWTTPPGTIAQDYGNGKDVMVCGDEMTNFKVGTPATAITLSETSLEIDNQVVTETTISLSSVTEGSDDYVRYYSDNQEAVLVKTPYTKAVQGEEITLAVKKKGKAVIYAESAAGKATASCTVVVKDGSDATPEPTQSPNPTASAVPTKVPVQTLPPEPTSTPKSTAAPEPSKVPGQTASPQPTTLPSPTASPGQTAFPTKPPLQRPTQRPDEKMEPTEIPDEKGQPAKKVIGEKGSRYQDKKTKARYLITAVGKNRAVKYMKGRKSAKTATIPATLTIGGKTYRVTAIATRAFAGNTKLRKVNIGTNVKMIGKKAFYGCKNLKKVKMGRNVESIQAEAFRKCTSLTLITLPKKLKKIGDCAFRQCRRLRYIMVKSEKLQGKHLGRNLFGGGYPYPRVKTYKRLWKKYAGFFLSRGLSGKALFIINPVRLVI